MRPLTLRGRFRFAGRVTVALVRHGLGFIKRPGVVLGQMGTRRPKRLLIAPQDIRTADPTRADDIHAGFFGFAGRTVNTQGLSPFDVEAPSPAWSRALTGFGWLRHLRAAKTQTARNDAQTLVADFIARPPRQSPYAQEPMVAARRMLSLLSQSPMILEGADSRAYFAFLAFLGQTQGRLRASLTYPRTTHERLQILIACASFALCAAVPPRQLARASSQLVRELKRQVLPDGGHITRNPAVLVDLLLDLLPLRQVYTARSQPVPPELNQAIDRMLPILRMFRHGDGTLALFNGMSVTAPDSVAVALAYDDAKAKPVLNARYSGYQRLEAGTSLLIMDAGSVPIAEASLAAHAGTLSFEFSDGDQRVIINCGAPDPARPLLAAAARATAAHSTLVIADTSSSLITGTNGTRGLLAGQIIFGAHHVPVLRHQDRDPVVIEASHDGYCASFGLIHARKVALGGDGSMLFGEDSLLFDDKLSPSKRSQPAETVFAIRFHLHPDVRAHMTRDATRVMLAASRERFWQFEAGGLPLALEESVLFAAPGGPRPTQQIVIHGISEGQMQVSWSLSLVRRDA